MGKDRDEIPIDDDEVLADDHPAVQRTRLKRWESFSLFGIICLSAALLIGLMVILSYSISLTVARTEQPPPLRYTQRTYTPAQATVCPDATRNPGMPTTLVFTPTLVIQNADVFIEVRRSYWSLDKNVRAPLRDGTPAKVDPAGTGFPDSVAGQLRANPVRVTIPDLPPGRYVLINNVWGANGSGVAKYQVFFTVPATCKYSPPT